MRGVFCEANLNLDNISLSARLQSIKYKPSQSYTFSTKACVQNLSARGHQLSVHDMRGPAPMRSLKNNLPTARIKLKA
jgi:hypothetical protein